MSNSYQNSGFIYGCVGKMSKAFHSRFNRRVLVDHPNIWSFIKILQAEENRFRRMHVQFNAGLGIRPKQAKEVAIQRHIDNLGQRYHDGAINATEYLDSLSFMVGKQKKWLIYYCVFIIDLFER